MPNEQAGLELAEELTTHIEKWLPDTPDRDQWAMEQPMGEYETPSAELPTELEDLVGELMEEEEDTFAEMEDASSSWMDSLDKGAGWDAMDGPISNMSAQGVTGNRLPNSSEIGGRSGEVRGVDDQYLDCRQCGALRRFCHLLFLYRLWQRRAAGAISVR